jgi:hypothetical protein
MQSKTTAVEPRDQSTRRVRVSGPARPIPLDQKLLYDFEDMASLSGLPVGAMRDLIRHDRGPRITWIGKHIRCTRKDFAAWIDEMRANSGVGA